MTADQHRRVLVVDDDQNVRTMLGALLRHRGLIVDEAADGKIALDLLRENRYAVILLDLLMPVADGFAVLRGFGTEGVQAPPVVLVLTGADRATIDQLDSQHIHGVVRKPFDPEELASLVVACSEVRSRGNMETMAMAVISGAPLLVWLNRLT